MLCIDERPPLKIILKRSECFMLLAQLQLALRHPDNTGASADWTRQLAATLENAVSISPAVARVARQGWVWEK